jgi:prepilin-type N-terminal cleavage/methylation domain-containing protein
MMIDMTLTAIRKRQRAEGGFTLIEIIISIMLMSILIALSTQAFDAGRLFYGKIQTTEILKNLQSAIQNAYSDNFKLMETTPAQVMTFPNNVSATGPNLTIGQSLRQANKMCTGTNSGTFAPIAKYLSNSSAQSYQDGYGAPVCIFITPQQTVTMNGVPVNFRTIAIVSGGRNSTVDPGTNLSPTGILTTLGDDVGVLIDGKSLAKNSIEITAKRLGVIVSSLETYYAARYQAGALRAPNINYFANGSSAGRAASNFDTTGPIPSTNGVAVPMTSIGLDRLLALSLSDVTDGYGNVFMFDNSSAAVRSPDNPNPNLSQAPYTASVFTTLPGGTVMGQTSVGAY